MNRIPSTFIAGVPKGGTTALAAIMDQHPDVYLSAKKEPRYYIYKDQVLAENDHINEGVITSRQAYEALYSSSTEDILIDGTPGYFSSHHAITAIHQELPQAKFIILLRDPVERAFSHFIFSIKMGYERSNATLQDIFEQDTVILKNGLSSKRPYLWDGYYDLHLNHLLNLFPREQVFITTSERFLKEQTSVLKEIESFLGIPTHTYNLEVGEHAKSGIPKNQTLHNALNKGGFLKHVLPQAVIHKLKEFRRNTQNKNLIKPELSNADRETLTNHFQPHIDHLKSICPINTTYWKNF